MKTSLRKPITRVIGTVVFLSTIITSSFILSSCDSSNKVTYVENSLGYNPNSNNIFGHLKFLNSSSKDYTLTEITIECQKSSDSSIRNVVFVPTDLSLFGNYIENPKLTANSITTITLKKFVGTSYTKVAFIGFKCEKTLPTNPATIPIIITMVVFFVLFLGGAILLIIFTSRKTVSFHIENHAFKVKTGVWNHYLYRDDQLVDSTTRIFGWQTVDLKSRADQKNIYIIIRPGFFRPIVTVIVDGIKYNNY